MQALGTKKERYHLHNYLTVLVKSLENRRTIIDLRNESSVVGLIKHVDGHMNVEIESAAFYDPRGIVHNFKHFYVSARNIRYVHIPEGLSMTDLMKNQLSQMKCSKVVQPKKDSFRTMMAKRYNADTVQRAYGAQPGPSGYK